MGVPAVCWTVVFLSMVGLATVSGGASPNDPNSVRIRRVSTPDYTSLVVENRRAYDVTVTLTIHAKNAQVTRIVPETSTYRGLSQTEAARISATDPGKPWRGRYHFRWTKGDLHARHEEQTRYRLPFRKGESYRVSQGYNGRWTHQGQDRYAVDFALPEGTTVCAARAGVVVDLRESSKVGGRDQKYRDECNYVSIAHADGTLGEYHHLQYDGVLVEMGERVAAGQAIALSGNTGYSTFPHLHFGVYSALDGSHRQSHRVTFVTREGIIAEPLAGKTYTAE
jgi:murein DD-endopeptidase MepM/ murein hydrolase activator NlpD